MSHRDDCPSDYEARRAGYRDYEDRGYIRYSTPFDDCDEAKAAYMRGQRSAEYDAEEQAMERRAAERREYELEKEENDYLEQQQQAEIARAYAEDCAREQELDYRRHIEQLEAERDR